MSTQIITDPEVLSRTPIRVGDLVTERVTEVGDSTDNGHYDGTVVQIEREVPGIACNSCHRERTLQDAYDYNPIQAITGVPLGWYSGDDGEICPECMTALLRGESR